MSHDLSLLRKFVSPEIIFGAGCRHTVANYAKTFGARKVLLVSDPGVVEIRKALATADAIVESTVDHVVAKDLKAAAKEIEEGDA